MLRDIDDNLIVHLFNGNVSGVMECISSGANINVKDPETGLTPIHIAAGMACDGLLDILLSTGKANLRIRDDRGRTPMDIAKQYRYRNIIEVINKHKRNPHYSSPTTTPQP